MLADVKRQLQSFGAGFKCSSGVYYYNIFTRVIGVGWKGPFHCVRDDENWDVLKEQRTRTRLHVFLFKTNPKHAYGWCCELREVVADSDNLWWRPLAIERS